MGERTWRCRDRVFDLDSRPLVMGILNVTPDSFSDGGEYADAERAFERGIALVKNGADILDIGGESSRPGAEPTAEEEEKRRIIPVIQRLSRAIDAAISVDTTKPSVAEAGLDAGAHVINDITGLSGGTTMARLAAESGAGIIIMHMRGTPRTMQSETSYEDLIGEIRGFFRRQVGMALEHGVSREQIVLDPGIGFGKSVEGNLEIIRRAGEFAIDGLPILIGPSRKSFIGEVLGRPVKERIWGTAATVALGIAFGAQIVRVHDVLEMTEVVRMTKAVLGAKCGH